MKHLKIKIDKYEIDWVEILKDIEFTLNKNDRISIVWWNWVWKTTILKIITWEVKNFDWIIENIWSTTLWYLAQIYNDNENKTVYEELKDWFVDINILEKELEILEERLKNNNDSTVLEEYSDKLQHFNNIWWYNYNSILMWVASGLWITSLLKSKLCEVSWWQRTKIALAKVLIHSPDILFLDEPTNFIDMASLEWLENYLQNKWKWWYVIVSHDREFLDKTCDKTYEIQPSRAINFYHTNYSEYVWEREKREKKIREDFERQDDWIKEQVTLVNRFRAWSRAGWAKSREKMLEKIEKVIPPYIPKKAKFLFWETELSQNKILTFKQVFIWRKEPLFFINELVLYCWQRIGIVWENWVWKSTFIKSILWQIEFLDWYFSRAKWLTIGYFSQMHEELNKEKTIRENFIAHWLTYSEQELVWILKHYLFEYEDIDRKVETLSGWQISKIAFAILGQKNYDLLILDEPTNHLDYDTREALEEALMRYKWTVLFISHDRYFVNKIATNIWIIKNDELIVSYWNYEDYKYKCEFWIDMDMSLFDEEWQLNLVLEEKLWEKEAKRLKTKFKKYKNK